MRLRMLGGNLLDNGDIVPPVNEGGEVADGCLDVCTTALTRVTALKAYSGASLSLMAYSHVESRDANSTSTGCGSLTTSSKVCVGGRIR